MAEEKVEPEEEVEEKSEEDEISEKAASIMARMAEQESVTDMPVLWFKEEDLKMAEEDYEVIPEAKYHDLDDDAKDAYEAVQVFEEGTGKGYGMRYRRRSPLERDSVVKMTKLLKRPMKRQICLRTCLQLPQRPLLVPLKSVVKDHTSTVTECSCHVQPWKHTTRL